jgi:hypothetical protein
MKHHFIEKRKPFMQRPISLMVSGVIMAGIWLPAGCATRNTQPAPPASSPAPVIVPGAEASSDITNAEANPAPTNLPAGDSLFSEYDAAVIGAIEKKWGDLTGGERLKSDRTGRVVVQFHLHPDGTVSDITTVENDVDVASGSVCEQSVKDAAPFAPWPPEMVKMVGTDYREITFKFNYY